MIPEPRCNSVTQYSVLAICRAAYHKTLARWLWAPSLLICRAATATKHRRATAVSGTTEESMLSLWWHTPGHAQIHSPTSRTSLSFAVPIGFVVDCSRRSVRVVSTYCCACLHLTSLFFIFQHLCTSTNFLQSLNHYPQLKT